MTTSQTKPFLYEFQNLDAKIPEGKLQYLQERLRNNLYDVVMTKFLEQEKERGLKKSDLARRIGYDSAQLNRLLGAPGNWTVKTISDLLAGICGEELACDTRQIGGGSRRNYTVEDEHDGYFRQDKKMNSRTGSDRESLVIVDQVS